MRLIEQLIIIPSHLQKVLIAKQLLSHGSKAEKILLTDALEDFDTEGLAITENQRSVHEESDLLVILEWGQEMSQIRELMNLLVNSAFNLLSVVILSSDTLFSFNYHESQADRSHK